MINNLRTAVDTALDQLNEIFTIQDELITHYNVTNDLSSNDLLQQSINKEAIRTGLKLRLIDHTINKYLLVD